MRGRERVCRHRSRAKLRLSLAPSNIQIMQPCPHLPHKRKRERGRDMNEVAVSDRQDRKTRRSANCDGREMTGLRAGNDSERSEVGRFEIFQTQRRRGGLTRTFWADGRQSVTRGKRASKQQDREVKRRSVCHCSSHLHNLVCLLLRRYSEKPACRICERLREWVLHSFTSSARLHS